MPCRWFLIFWEQRGAAALLRLVPERDGHPLRAVMPRGAAKPRRLQAATAAGDSQAILDPSPNEAPDVTNDGTRHPQDTVLLKTTGFRRSFGALFGCCGAGTHFVHLSFRVKSALPVAS